MVSRKRGREEMEDEAGAPQEEVSVLQKIRNMWEFASLMQYIFFFGKAVKIEEVEVEEFEQECIKPTHSEHLSRMGLALLKYVSSHKGLTLDIFDEYTRRQYQAKAPQRNPFGDEEEPNKFADFDIFTKIRVLHQLSIWTLNNPNPIREKMAEVDETQWRIEPLGWDAKDREYYVLDDDRLYRRTAPPLPPVPKTPKSKPKPKRNTRSNKRRRVSRAIPDTSPEDSEATPEVNGFKEDEQNNFAGFTWELIAITLEEYRVFLDTIRKSRDDNEKILRRRIESEVLPVIEQRAEEKERDAARRLREMENLQKLATAKRSSRIADKMEKQKAIQDAEDAERKRLADLEMAHREQERQDKLDADRQSRMMTREQRIREREVKRILQEEQLAKEKEQLAKLEEQGRIEDAERARISERQLKADMQKRQTALLKLQQQEDEWVFDCAVCGLHGQNLDDGTHSIACEKCNVWQHSACHGITKEQAERDDFHFLCRDCKHRVENPIPPLKLRFGTSASPPSAEKASKTAIAVGIPARPKTSGPMKIPNGFNMSSVYPQAQGYRPPSAGSSVMNGSMALATSLASPTKLTSPLVYPGPPPPPPTLTPQHSYTHTSPSPPRPSSSGYSSHTMNGHAAPSTTLPHTPSLHYRPNGAPYPPFNNTIYTPQSYGSWQNVQPFHSPYPRQSPPSRHHNYYQQPPPQIPAPSYSPHKPQPHSPSPASTNGYVGYQPLSAPPTLSPTQAPPILSPPVKKATPTPTPERPILTGELDGSQQQQQHPQPLLQPQQLASSPVKIQSTMPPIAADSQAQNPIVPAVTQPASVVNQARSEST